MRLMLSAFFGLVCVCFQASHAAPPATRPAVEAYLNDVSHVEIHLQFFTPEKNDFHRSLDLSVVGDDESTDAEGLMHADQAARVLRSLDKRDFFDHAQPMAGADWGPQTEPFYVLSIDGTGAGAIYEKLPIDLKTGRMLVGIREALGKGPAGITIDRYAAMIDPSLQRWKDKPATLPTAASLAALPAPDSKQHPGHRFDAIDPTWTADISFTKPDEKGGHWIGAPFADPKECYVVAEYRVGEGNAVLKTVTYFPSGKVFAERDCHARYIDMLPPKGDEFERRFAEDGTIVFYAHWTDGHCVDGFSSDSNGKNLERVEAGKGSLTEPSIGGPPMHLTFK